MGSPLWNVLVLAALFQAVWPTVNSHATLKFEMWRNLSNRLTLTQEYISKVSHSVWLLTLKMKFEVQEKFVSIIHISYNFHWSRGCHIEYEEWHFFRILYTTTSLSHFHILFIGHTHMKRPLNINLFVMNNRQKGFDYLIISLGLMIS